MGRNSVILENHYNTVVKLKTVLGRVSSQTVAYSNRHRSYHVNIHTERSHFRAGPCSWMRPFSLEPGFVENDVFRFGLLHRNHIWLRHASDQHNAQGS